ncbi:S-linalool synthase-like [Malania oleifera]|uniref:S-linalool synthase-like n=1 Tax=Malania oleifera TaxID=397392 RepID=UPI0025AEC1CE|nr:S-linalool synthase-like [Malania oleifera]
MAASSKTSSIDVKSLVDRVKERHSVLLSSSSSSVDLYAFVSPSAYDTAWLAMVPDPQRRNQPAFAACLQWILDNQRVEGIWGEVDGHGVPSIDTIPATLACMAALRRWNVGDENIEKGLEFIHANADKLLTSLRTHCPRWFAIVFPAMLELAGTNGVNVVFPNSIRAVVTQIFSHRQIILNTEKLVDGYHYPPLLSFCESLPSSWFINEDRILNHLGKDGSLFQSPSATASAYMVTGNEDCITYLKCLVQKCSSGVPAIYPMDEELIKLCMVDQLERLGVAEHFTREIEECLKLAYINYKSQELSELNLKPAKVFKDSLAFRLLRMHGYRVSPKSFCWFLHHEDIKGYLQNNFEEFSSVMFSIYRATDLMFSSEYELEEARSFSKKLLEMTLSSKSRGDNLIMFTSLPRVIEHELSLPWIARMEHLDHRLWIEENEVYPLWVGKASFYRLSCLHNDELMRLAVKNFEFRQSIYRNELEELKRWSKDWGLTSMGFGREKTSYCYFGVASCCSLPPNSEVRMIVAKSAIVITVADDFFDMEGSMNELISLTEAVGRWDGKGLSSATKTIFDALNNIVSDIATRHFHQQGSDITKGLRDIWYETFGSWLTEAKRSKTQCLPSMDEYLKTGMVSIAIHTIVLPASCFFNPSLPNHKLKPSKYETATTLSMQIARMLNDIQSYQKELEEGKLNLVLLYLKENPKATIEDSIAYVTEILDKKKKELIEEVLMDGLSANLPKPSKHFHLSCTKVYQMFFYSSNGFDSNTKMLPHIQRAIYFPLQVCSVMSP